MIDARQLMVGDWVYNSYHRKNIQWNYGEMFCPNGNPVIGKDLQPIPLTVELLEKNGWKKAIGENPVEVWSIGRGAYLHKTDNGYKLREGAEFNVPNIQYVHTLQHALRLCGLSDLADNFRID